MKKVAKSFLFVMMMIIMVCALTGCGDEKNNKKSDSSDSKKISSDVLIATKSEEGSAMGTYNETIEITFKDGKANSVTETMEFEDEKTAEYVGSLMQITANSLDGMEFSQEGMKITIKMNPETFISGLGVEDDLSREAIEKNLENNGFKIEK